MLYVSTRGGGAPRTFEEILLAGLAPDGGLYIPQNWPTWSPQQWQALRGAPFHVVAAKIMAAFTGGNPDEAELLALSEAAYSTFRHEAVVPIIQLNQDIYILELFHGPTLAFKDVAMQLLARLIARALEKNGQHATIVGATSGDTGSAALAAFANINNTHVPQKVPSSSEAVGVKNSAVLGQEHAQKNNVDTFILYPHGRISEVQRRQMTTHHAAHLHTLAVEGTFDDCQAHVKAMFRDEKFRAAHNLVGVNSINWARIVAQVVYYVTTALSFDKDQLIDFAVPTGNFGDVYAGFVANQMGLPNMGQLIVATNENDILARALQSGVYETRGVVPTHSPSMDIQVSSNFERLLYQALDNDAAHCAALMHELATTGRFVIPQQALQNMRARFCATSVSNAQTLATIRETYEKSGYQLDPHTAIGLHAAMQHHQQNPEHNRPTVVLATAHPAKFPDAMQKAIGITPELPPHMADLYERKETITPMANDTARIKEYIAKTT